MVRNTLTIFIVSGFWHGANWTFIVWGALNAVYFIPLLLLNKNRDNLDIVAKGKRLPHAKDVFGMVSTFSLVVLTWVFFRAENLKDALSYLSAIFSRTLFTTPHYFGKGCVLTIVLIIIFLLIEWIGRENQYAISQTGFSWPKPMRWTFYYSLIAAICFFGGSEQQFIYFQF